MTSILKVDELQDTSGNLIIKEDSNTITIGASGDTITIPSGATITNSGTATGFGGITMADQYRMSANRTSDEDPISSGVERVDSTGFGSIGTGMTNTSGIFSFPTTGIYLVRLITSTVRSNTNDNNIDVAIHVTTDNSSYTSVASATTSGTTAPTTMQGSAEVLVDVTDTSLVKVKFVYASSNSNTLAGDTDKNRTSFTFIRLGDT